MSDLSAAEPKVPKVIDEHTRLDPTTGLPKLSRQKFNPFMHRTPELGVLEWIKVLVLGPTLAPIRVVLVALIFILGALITRLLLVGAPRNPAAPLPKWRSTAINTVVSWFARAILFVFGFYWIKVKGEISKEARILVPNHVAYFDPLIFVTYGVSHVAKSSLLGIPLVNWYARGLQLVMVDRTNKQSCDDTKTQINMRAESSDWPMLCLYPEGTTSNGLSVLQFKRGAFVPGVPVQPAVVSYPSVNFHPSFCYGGRLNYLRILCQFVQYAEVEFLPVHYPTAREKKDPALFAEAVRAEMAEALNVVMTNHSLGDVLLEVAAMKRNLPYEACIVGFGDFQKLFDLSVDDAKLYIERFAEVDEDKDGLVSLDELKKALGDFGSNISEALFTTFDQDEDGVIDFREFVAALEFISRNVTLEETIAMAFDYIDQDHDDIIVEDEVQRAVEVLSLEPISREKVHELFLEMDVDKSGRVDRQRFETYLKEHPDIMRGPRKLRLFEQYKLDLASKDRSKKDL